VTEVYNSSTGTDYDWLFLSVEAIGTITSSGSNSCTGPCVYSFNVQSSVPTTSTKATDGFGSTGGTSGIIVDNTVNNTGASQIYYETLGTTDAIQVVQNGL
jgi:hypothetical protein